MPIFMILMGIALGISGIKANYIMSKFKRVIVPFLILWILSFFYGVFYVGQVYLGPDSWYGVLPVSGSGNYFITTMFEFIILAPVIWAIHIKSPKIMLLVMLYFNAMYEYIYWHTDYQYTYYYNASIVRWLVAIGIGLYISKELVETGQVKISKPIQAFFLFSFLYLIYEPVDFQNLLALGYPFMFILLIINKQTSIKWLEWIGKKSYEIFLAQIMVFR